jgi:hypothetical protein
MDQIERGFREVRAAISTLAEAMAAGFADLRAGLGQRIDRLERSHEGLSETVAFMRMDLNVVKADVRTLKSHSRSHAQKLDRIFEHLKLNGGRRRKKR